MAQHIYYGLWHWDGESWDAPVRNVPHGNFDLRSRADCASPGLSAGKGIFVYPQRVLDPRMTYLGERGASVALRKAAIAIDLKLGERIVADTVDEMVAELLGPHAEPCWNARWGRLRGPLKCLGETWHAYQLREGQADYLRLLECLRANYQQVKAATLAGRYPPDYHLKYLQYQMEQYRVVNYDLITGDSREQPQRHGTAWTEDWPTLGTTISTGQDQPWTEVLDDLQVVSVVSVNRLENLGVSVNGSARCTTALAGDAQICQATLRMTVATSTLGGPATRFAAAAHDLYHCHYVSGAGVEAVLRKVVTGTASTLATADVATASANVDYVLKLTSTADDLHTMTIDGGAAITDHSNGDITGNTLAGLFCRGAGASRCRLSAVSAEDIAAAAEATVAAGAWYPVYRASRGGRR